MKVFTKSFLVLLLCMLGVMNVSAKTEKVHATFANPSNTNTTWNAETKTFTWSTTYYNQLRNIGLPSGDLSKYKKLVVDCTINSGSQFRILFYKGGSNLTLYASNGVNEFILADTLKSVNPNEYNEYLLACDEICLSGNNNVAPGEAIINDVYLETYDDEGEKVYATFASPSNTNTTWNAETKTFTWSTTYYNQLRNIGLPKGDISKYKKLVVDTEIKSGNQFRILFYKGGSNLTLYASNGVNEFILADTLKTLYPNDYNEYLLACDEICLSGNNNAAPGEAVINSVYLETYPENEQFEIPEIVYEEDPGVPAGDFVDFTTAFPSLQPRIGLGTDGHPIVLGNGEVVVGQRSKDVIADLSPYSKLTMVTSPNLKLVLYMNHEVDAQQNAPDYAEADAGKYVFMDVQADENGLIEVDLTQFDKQDLNCITLPWDNSNKGTVWHILLTKAAAPVAADVTFDFNASNHATSTNESQAGDINKDEVNTVDGVVMTITPSEAATPNRYWSTKNGPQLRMYGGSMTLEAPEGKAITKVVFNNGKWETTNTINGEVAATGLWEGNSTNVVLAVAKNTQMNSVVVTLADKNEETTTYEVPVNYFTYDGPVYIIDAESGKFIAAGNAYGTHGIIGEIGLDLTLKTNAETKMVTIDTKVSAGGEKHFLGSNLYMDASAAEWGLLEKDFGFYITDGTKYLSIDANDNLALSDEPRLWIIVTPEGVKDQILKDMAAATRENPVDATFFIKANNYNRGDQRNTEAWKGDAYNVGGAQTNMNAEKWGGNSQNFNVYQTINVPDGVYRVTWNGFYRYNNTDANTNDVAAAAHADGTEVINSFVYINDNEYPLTSIADETAVAAFGKMPFSQADASDAFGRGLYEQSTEVTVIGGKMTIGVKKIQHLGTDWTVWDNFRLTYLTSEIPAEFFQPEYEKVLAAAKAALANEANAAITGDEKAALEKAIADNSEIAEPTADLYKAAISALTNATTAFTSAQPAYVALADAKKAMASYVFNYAADEKKQAAEAAAEATAANAADAAAKTAALQKAYRQYAESSALLEGLEDAKIMTDSIKNPDSNDGTNGWQTVLGAGSGGSINILDGEPFTDGSDNAAHKYFDGGNWGAQAWDVTFQQKIALPAGKYQLTATTRSAADVALSLFAGADSTKAVSIGAAGGLFNRGWNDASVEFVLADADSIVIGVRGVTEMQYNWMSFTRFRLVQFPEEKPAEQIIPTDVAEPTYTYPAKWNFTNWTEATVANLKADAARSIFNGWSDVEKDPAQTDKNGNLNPQEPTEASKDNCFWHQGKTDAYGQLYANGVLVEELKGLKFSEAYAQNRSLAIAVNYPSTTLGTYDGPQYLWLGGGGKSVPCFELPNVPAGMSITMVVESHKPSDARGVELYKGSINAANKIGDSFKPKTKDTFTWDITEAEAGNIVVYNTSGCHIYSIEVKKTPVHIADGFYNLTSDMYHVWTSNYPDGEITEEQPGFENHIGEELGAGKLVYGNGSVAYLQYADLTGYDSLAIIGTPGMQLRVLLNRLEVGNGGGDGNGGALVVRNPVVGENGLAFVDLRGFEYVHLNSIKTDWTSPTGTIGQMGMVKGAFDPSVVVGIQEISTAKVAGIVYDLQGRRVAQPARGLYIVDGKKMLFK